MTWTMWVEFDEGELYAVRGAMARRIDALADAITTVSPGDMDAVAGELSALRAAYARTPQPADVLPMRGLRGS